MSGRRRRLRLPSKWHLILVPMSIVTVLPFVWLLLSSVMTQTELNRFPPAFWPQAIDLDGYRSVMERSDFPRWFLNSLVVSASIVLAQLVLCSMAGYAFARIRFIGSRLTLVLVIATSLIPFQLTVIPTFLIFSKVGLTDTLGALIVPQLSSAVGIYLMTSFFRSFPGELEEAARIDGCSRLGVLFRVVLPVARPALAALGIITFITAWNDLFWPLVAINSEANYTLQVGLTTFQGLHRANWPAIMAGAVMVTLPVLVVFLVGQRRFVQALTGAVKG
ncbi:ABC transporter permease [Spongiactinospora gelatinilytica]|uniref:ABC transporter permease n=1 Tax=Spongiactinospora gelatinilytica TaxID=2666298 RepID=A0A2W2GNX0_9ACTN|nr:carbohydrate ABC transporter permease [Spongiactinospora gelatinilytica]PZG39030.1 ABC transporter permease [Spongiactinospora gelatinilytica]